jgi:hypothetical protein
MKNSLKRERRINERYFGGMCVINHMVGYKWQGMDKLEFFLKFFKSLKPNQKFKNAGKKINE